MKNENEEQREEPRSRKESKLIALKDFKFAFGKDVYEIKEGQEVKVPKMFLANLKTENVIK